MNQTDAQLLALYAGQRSEAAFTELVQRHIDFVYSAALRMVCDSHLAQDVTQAVFVALAKNPGQLKDHPVLSGWLHRTAQNIAAQTVRTDVRRRAREQEAAAMNELLSAEPAAAWEQIAPQLDAALGELNGPDRDALLLRYFERKSAREMAQILGTSEEAAQKRVSRAVERLRECLSQRKVTIGAGGLVVLISANAVQSAPVGLATTISIAGAISGTTLAAITKTIAMTTLQKTLVAAAFIVTIGAGLYQARNASVLRNQVLELQQSEAPLTAQARQFEDERDGAVKKLTTLTEAIAGLRGNSDELLKLRAEVTRLRGAASQANDPFVQQALTWKARENKLRKLFADHPEQRIPEMGLLGDDQWLYLAKGADLDSDIGIRQAQSEVRRTARNDFMPDLMGVLGKYVNGNAGLLPTDLNQLQPYFNAPVDEAILQQYKLLHTGNFNDLPSGEWPVSTRSVIDQDYDMPWHVSPNGFGPMEPPASSDTTWMQDLGPAIQAYMIANNGQMPPDVSQLKPYLTTPAQNTAFKKATKIGVQFGNAATASQH